jgi:hypothetical protein
LRQTLVFLVKDDCYSPTEELIFAAKFVHISLRKKAAGVLKSRCWGGEVMMRRCRKLAPMTEADATPNLWPRSACGAQISFFLQRLARDHLLFSTSRRGSKRAVLLEFNDLINGGLGGG